MITFLSTYPVWLVWPPADLYHLTTHTYASASWIARPPGPSIVTVHDIGLYLAAPRSRRRDLRGRAQELAERVAVRALKRFDALITVSEWTKQSIVEKTGIPAQTVSTVHLGIDHERYRRMAVTEDFRKRYRLDPGRRYLLYVGNDEPRKNLPTVWQAIGLICRRFPDATLLKVGRGYDAQERSRLVRLAAELGIERAIRYFDDVPEADLPLFYNHAEALVMPSLYEGFGLPVLEAMACATPVVASDRGALRELVDESVSIVVDPSDPSSVADAVVRLLEDRDLAAHVGAAGYERSLQFSWEKMIEGTIDVYRRTLDATAGVSRTFL